MPSINLGPKRFSGKKDASIVCRIPGDLKGAVTKLWRQLKYEDESSFVFDLLVQYVTAEVEAGRLTLEDLHTAAPVAKKKSK